MDIALLQQRLGHTFKSTALLQQALTHRSHSSLHNERLEFLGDSVLNCVVAALLFEKFNKIDEGDLSRLRANLVKQQSLYEIAQRLELSQFLRLGEGELKSGGFRRPSILADTLEALFGAIYLDSGFDAARDVIRAMYVPILQTVDPKTLGKDAKTLLQEFLQGKKFRCRSTTWSRHMVPRITRSLRWSASYLNSTYRYLVPEVAAVQVSRPPRDWRSRQCNSRLSKRRLSRRKPDSAPRN